MSNKPFPFSVCKECCVGGESGGGIAIDTQMSDTSENAVQNKVIKKYVDNEIANIELGDVNLEGYATEEYVDTAIQTAIGGVLGGAS